MQSGRRKEIILISLSKEQTEGLFMRKMDSVEEAIKYAERSTIGRITY